MERIQRFTFFLFCNLLLEITTKNDFFYSSPFFSAALDYFAFGSSVTSSGPNNLGGTYYPQASSTIVEKILVVVRKTPIPANTQFIFPIRIEDEIGNSLETALSIVTAPLPPQFAEEKYLWKIAEQTPVGTE